MMHFFSIPVDRKGAEEAPKLKVNEDKTMRFYSIPVGSHSNRRNSSSLSC